MNYRFLSQICREMMGTWCYSLFSLDIPFFLLDCQAQMTLAIRAFHVSSYVLCFLKYKVINRHSDTITQSHAHCTCESITMNWVPSLNADHIRYGTETPRSRPDP